MRREYTICGKIIDIIESPDDFNTSGEVIKIIKDPEGWKITDGWSSERISVLFKRVSDTLVYFSCRYKSNGGIFNHEIGTESPFFRETSRGGLAYIYEYEPYDETQEPEDDCL